MGRETRRERDAWGERRVERETRRERDAWGERHVERETRRGRDIKHKKDNGKAKIGPT